MPTIEEIKEFWEKRAEELETGCTATLRETPLRELEIRAILKYLTDGVRIIDIGCGNGFSTIEFAKNVKSDFLGIDYSEKMIFYAKEALKLQDAGALKGVVQFEIGDVLKLQEPEVPFDIAITERCLQNLPTWDLQQKAIIRIASVLRSGGLLIMTEGSLTGVNRLNRLRSMIGKPELEGAIPWHNKFFEDQALVRDPVINQAYDFIKIDHFCSTYMLMTRLVGPKYADFAKKLPNIGTFGYIKTYLWQKKKEGSRGKA